MEIDYYDDALPEQYMSLAEHFQQNKEAIKIMSIPVIIFVIGCAISRIATKEMKSL